jgi:hypothetical protein
LATPNPAFFGRERATTVFPCASYGRFETVPSTGLTRLIVVLRPVTIDWLNALNMSSRTWNCLFPAKRIVRESAMSNTLWKQPRR